MSQRQLEFNNECILQFCNGNIPADYIYCYPALLPSSQNTLPIGDYFLHRVIVWDVQKLAPSLTINCPTCADRCLVQGLTPTRWKSGDGASRDKPRILYDCKGLVLLVSRVYYCKNQHEFVAHDERIICQSRTHIAEPFVLFHKSGLTKNLFALIESHDDAGLCVADTMKVWHQLICISYQDIRNSYCSRNRSFNKHDFPTDYLDIFDGKKGQKLITATLNTLYYTKEHFYDNRMSLLSATSISCDHTFKVPVNIGLWINQKWIRICKSLFIVLNENGLVVGWQLCRDAKFETVENILERLSHRFQKSGKELKYIHIDNCCTWRAQLKRIFGEDILVKLDWFHGLKRITSEIPRKKGVTDEMKSLRRKMVACLKMVVRQPHDYGNRRKSETADEGSIERNLDEFLKMWSNQTIDDTPVLPKSAVKAINGLLVHVRIGCLSHIPPSGGTNRNEAIHRPLNKAFKGQRFGVQTAVSSLGKFFYRWNERKQSINKSIILPVDFYPIGNPTDEYFGTEQRRMPSFGDTNQMNGDFQAPQFNLHQSSGSLNENDESSDEEGETNTVDADEDDGHADIALDVFNKCQEKMRTIDLLEEYVRRTVMDDIGAVCHPLGLLTLFLTTDNRSVEDRHTFSTELQRKCSLKKHCSPESLNSMSFYVCIVCAIEHISSDLTQEDKSYFENLGLLSQNRHDKVLRLVSLSIEEYAKNEIYYKSFVSDGNDYCRDLENFKENMAMESPFCKLLFLAAAEVLRLPLVVLTDMEHFPVLCIFPRVGCRFPSPVFIQFHNTLDGSFKVTHLLNKGETISCAENVSVVNAKNNNGCRCGMGANKNKTDSVSCQNIRCRCFLSIGKCSGFCSCHHCSNPYGSRPHEVHGKTGSRKRSRPSHTTETTPSLSFANERSYDTIKAPWNRLENLVMVDIVTRLSGAQSSDIITDVVRKIYADVAELFKYKDISIKENTQLDRKMKEIFLADQTRHHTFLSQMALLK